LNFCVLFTTLESVTLSLICRVVPDHSIVHYWEGELEGQARLLLANCYGSDNVLQIIRQTVNERVLKSIKPLTPAQLSKKASSDLKKSMAQKIKKDKAQRKVRNAQADLAVINRQPA